MNEAKLVDNKQHSPKLIIIRKDKILKRNLNVTQKEKGILKKLFMLYVA